MRHISSCISKRDLPGVFRRAFAARDIGVIHRQRLPLLEQGVETQRGPTDLLHVVPLAHLGTDGLGPDGPAARLEFPLGGLSSATRRPLRCDGQAVRLHRGALLCVRSPAGPDRRAPAWIAAKAREPRTPRPRRATPRDKRSPTSGGRGEDSSAAARSRGGGAGSPTWAASSWGTPRGHCASHGSIASDLDRAALRMDAPTDAREDIE